MNDPVIVVPNRLDQLLAPPREVESDVATLLQCLYDRRYDGPITLHFRGGKPFVVDLPCPKIKLQHD